MQESRIGRIAEDIAGRKGVKFVMIAGPSSSGKTTFSHRLSIQLKTFGLTPHPIEVDNYFVNREKTPRDADGNYNFESLDAIDTERFNRDMCELLEGKRIELPTFNFKTGKREYKGNFLQLGADDILVIEGIHGLNDKMSYALPNESKYKIYISALTSLNVDEHNRIPRQTEDCCVGWCGMPGREERAQDRQLPSGRLCGAARKRIFFPSRKVRMRRLILR